MNLLCTKLIFSTCLSGFEHHAVTEKRPVIYGILLIISSKWQQLWCSKYLLKAVTQRVKRENRVFLVIVCLQTSIVVLVYCFSLLLVSFYLKYNFILLFRWNWYSPFSTSKCIPCICKISQTNYKCSLELTVDVCHILI